MKTKQELVKTLKAYPNKRELLETMMEVAGESYLKFHNNRLKAGEKQLVNPNTLELASEFQANGQIYFILRPEDGLNVLRMYRLKQMLSIVVRDQSFSDQMAFLSTIMDYFNSIGSTKPKMAEFGAALINEKNRLENTRVRKWDYSKIACTLFIVRPDEDLTKWTEQDANRKIKDWEKEGIANEDFFLCSMIFGKLWSARRESLKTKVDQLVNQRITE